MYAYAFFIIALLLFHPGYALAGWKLHLQEHDVGSDVGDKALHVEVFYQDGKMRIDRQEVSLILDLHNQRATIIHHGAQMFSSASLEEFAPSEGLIGTLHSQAPLISPHDRILLRRQLHDLETHHGETAGSYALFRTGKERVIAGRHCELYRTHEATGIFEACIQKDHGDSLAGLPTEAAKLGKRLWYLEHDATLGAASLLRAAAIGGWLLAWEFEAFDANYRRVGEVTSIEFAVLPDSVFAVANGYINMEEHE